MPPLLLERKLRLLAHEGQHTDIPADVAPTLSSYPGLKPSSSAEGTPFEEVLR